MKAKGGHLWTYDEVFKFIKSPGSYIPGTKMSFAGLRSEKDRIDLIAFLRTEIRFAGRNSACWRGPPPRQRLPRLPPPVQRLPPPPSRARPRRRPQHRPSHRAAN